MKLKQLSENHVEVRFDAHKILFSHGTPIAAWIPPKTTVILRNVPKREAEYLEEWKLFGHYTEVSGQFFEDLMKEDPWEGKGWFNLKKYSYEAILLFSCATIAGCMWIITSFIEFLV